MNMCHRVYILFCREDNVEVAGRLEASRRVHVAEVSYEGKNLRKESMSFK